MEAFLQEYAAILVFLGLALILGIVMMAGSWIVAVQNADTAKTAPYECGFPPFKEARVRFDVHFYLVSILFIIFDLEIAFLFPWAVALEEAGIWGFWSMFVFLLVLTIGFIYEWKNGALEWK